MTAGADLLLADGSSALDARTEVVGLQDGRVAGPWSELAADRGHLAG